MQHPNSFNPNVYNASAQPGQYWQNQQSTPHFQNRGTWNGSQTYPGRQDFHYSSYYPANPPAADNATVVSSYPTEYYTYSQGASGSSSVQNNSSFTYEPKMQQPAYTLPNSQVNTDQKSKTMQYSNTNYPNKRSFNNSNRFNNNVGYKNVQSFKNHYSTYPSLNYHDKTNPSHVYNNWHFRGKRYKRYSPYLNQPHRYIREIDIPSYNTYKDDTKTDSHSKQDECKSVGNVNEAESLVSTSHDDSSTSNPKTLEHLLNDIFTEDERNSLISEYSGGDQKNKSETECIMECTSERKRKLSNDAIVTESDDKTVDHVADKPVPSNSDTLTKLLANVNLSHVTTEAVDIRIENTAEDIISDLIDSVLLSEKSPEEIAQKTEKQDLSSDVVDAINFIINEVIASEEKEMHKIQNLLHNVIDNVCKPSTGPIASEEKEMHKVQNLPHNVIGDVCKLSTTEPIASEEREMHNIQNLLPSLTDNVCKPSTAEPEITLETELQNILDFVKQTSSVISSHETTCIANDKFTENISDPIALHNFKSKAKKGIHNKASRNKAISSVSSSNSTCEKENTTFSKSIATTVKHVVTPVNSDLDRQKDVTLDDASRKSIKTQTSKKTFSKNFNEQKIQNHVAKKAILTSDKNISDVKNLSSQCKENHIRAHRTSPSLTKLNFQNKITNICSSVSYTNASILNGMKINVEVSPVTAYKTLKSQLHVAKKSLVAIHEKELTVPTKPKAKKSICASYQQYSDKASISNNHVKEKCIFYKDRNTPDHSQSHLSIDSEPEIIFETTQVKKDTCDLLELTESKNSDGKNSTIQKFKVPKETCKCSTETVKVINDETKDTTLCSSKDCIDGKMVQCTNKVNKNILLTPSLKFKPMAYCDIHLWRMQKHHCCPFCNVFCTQGMFVLCEDRHSKGVNHLFHEDCFFTLKPGLPPCCPHCGKFADFKMVNLELKSESPCEELDKQDCSPSTKNITKDLENYNIIMKCKQSSNQETKSDGEVYPHRELQLQSVITTLAKEKSNLKLTEKNLYSSLITCDSETIVQMLECGVNPNHKFSNNDGNSLLHIAAFYGSVGITHLLVQAGAVIDAVNDKLMTPLIVAAQRNHFPVTHYLRNSGAKVDTKTDDGMTAFHMAISNGNKSIAKLLYNTGRMDINQQDDGGWTPLVWACENKNADIVKWLLEMGANPNLRDNEENGALHWVASSGEGEIAELLLDNGSILNAVNKHGDTPMHIAARQDRYECVKLFLSRGSCINLKNKDNLTPLMCCNDNQQISWKTLNDSNSQGDYKSKHNVVFSDVSCGKEMYPIQVVNDIDGEEFKMDFKYVLKNCNNSDIKIIETMKDLKKCYCEGNCSTSDCFCKSVKSQCWYDVDGHLISDLAIEDPPTVFECNELCHCPKSCTNRIVQHGLQKSLQVFRTRTKGWGVQTLSDLPKGTFVCEYVGELVNDTISSQCKDDNYILSIDSKHNYCLDAHNYGNISRFLNHSCNPNLITVKLFADHQELNFPRIAFFTVRDVTAQEELCFDYGIDFWIPKCQLFLCVCKSSNCRYSKDTITDTLEQWLVNKKMGTS